MHVRVWQSCIWIAKSRKTGTKRSDHILGRYGLMKYASATAIPSIVSDKRMYWIPLR